MWLLPIELGALDARHARALGLHLLALDSDDRYARFGQSLSDEAAVSWVHRAPWRRDRWTGAWGGPDNVLLGAVQLARFRRADAWELAMTVVACARYPWAQRFPNSIDGEPLDSYIDWLYVVDPDLFNFKQLPAAMPSRWT